MVKSIRSSLCPQSNMYRLCNTHEKTKYTVSLYKYHIRLHVQLLFQMPWLCSLRVFCAITTLCHLSRFFFLNGFFNLTVSSQLSTLRLSKSSFTTSIHLIKSTYFPPGSLSECSQASLSLFGRRQCLANVRKSWSYNSYVQSYIRFSRWHFEPNASSVSILFRYWYFVHNLETCRLW